MKISKFSQYLYRLDTCLHFFGVDIVILPRTEHHSTPLCLTYAQQSLKWSDSFTWEDFILIWTLEIATKPTTKKKRTITEKSKWLTSKDSFKKKITICMCTKFHACKNFGHSWEMFQTHLCKPSCEAKEHNRPTFLPAAHAKSSNLFFKNSF